VAIAAGRRFLRVRAPRLRTAAIWGLLDQALLSATNFLTFVLIARSLEPADFGVFVLAYSALMVANSLQTALITQPHNVLAAASRGGDYVRYTSTTVLTQFVFSGACGLVILVAGVASAVAGYGFAQLLFALLPAIVAWQLQELGRRILYTEGRLSAVFVNDAISYGGQLIAIVVLFYGRWLSGPTALYALAATSAAAAAVAAWQLRPSLRPILATDLVRQQWRFGKWLVASAVLGHASPQIYLLLTAGLVGFASTGALKAAQTAMGPTRILLLTLEAVTTPRAARIYAAEGSAALRAYVAFLYLSTFLPMGIYCAIVTFSSDAFMRLFYGQQYESYGWVATYTAVAYFVAYLAAPASIGVRARGQTVMIFRANVAAAAVGLTLGVFLVWTLGLLGAALGSIGNAIVFSLVLCAGFWWRHDHTTAIRAGRND
jgi:O-antigen/teichoic acid export membrane protein